MAPIADALASIIITTDVNNTPLTLGILGPWGSGKTSLMQMISKRVDSLRLQNKSISIGFDAWRYGQDNALWRAFLLSVVEGLRLSINEDGELLQDLIKQNQQDIGRSAQTNIGISPDKWREKFEQKLDDLNTSLYRNVEREEVGGLTIDWGKAGAKAVRAAIRVGFSMMPVIGPALNVAVKTIEKAQEKIGEGEDAAALFDIFQRERSKIFRDQVQSVEQFYRQLRELVHDWIVRTGRRLIIFIDDLDRCLPEQSVSVLEALKVLLDIKGCIFVLAFDREIIEHGIRVRYKDFFLAESRTGSIFPIAGRDYLEKIIHIPFEMPPLANGAMYEYVKTRIGNGDELSAEEVDVISAIVSTGIVPNPRRVKRVLNTLRLLLMLSEAHKTEVNPILLAKLNILQNSYPKVYSHVIRVPSSLLDLENILFRDVLIDVFIGTGSAIDERYFAIAPMFDGMSTLLDNLRDKAIQFGSMPETDRHGLYMDLQVQAIKQVQACIPPRLFNVFRREPRFTTDGSRLDYYIYLTQIAKLDNIVDSSSPSFEIIN